MFIFDYNYVIEIKYKIPVNDNLRKDVSVMCNLSQGIVGETKIEVMTKVVKKIIEENEHVPA